MLPQLGEMLSKGSPKAAAPFMSACIIVTQLVDCAHGGLDWKAGCGQRTKTTVAPRLRCPSHTRSSLHHYTFCGGANCDSDSRRRGERRIGIVSILIIKDRTQGTGRFNLAAGSLATMVGIGAAASTSFGGVLIQHFGYPPSFLA